jgi:hypothetical protein
MAVAARQTRVLTHHCEHDPTAEVTDLLELEVQFLVGPEPLLEEATDRRLTLDELHPPVQDRSFGDAAHHPVDITAIQSLNLVAHKLDRVGRRGLLGHPPPSIPDGICCRAFGYARSVEVEQPKPAPHSWGPKRRFSPCRVALVLFAFALPLIGVVACGESGQVEEVEVVVKAYFRADDPAHCEKYVTQDYRAELRRLTGESCERAVAAGAGGGIDVKVGDVTVEGNNADADIEVPQSDPGADTSRADTVVLLKERGDWKVDGFK